MKAVVCPSYGLPDVLQIKELEKPVPRDNEVLVKVKAVTVNRTDCAILSAKPFFMRFVYGLFKPKKSTPGTDFAGVVEAIGKEVSSFKSGDKVFGFNDGGLSSHAEYLTISADHTLSVMPENFSYAEAVACLEGAHYALNIINKVDLKSGDKVLVNGASGAIGSATLQMVKYFGGEAVAVVDTKNKERIKALGADQVIDFTQEDFTHKKEQQYDFVFDTVGKSTFGKCLPLLKPGGVYISSELGPYYQNIFYALFASVLSKLPSYRGKKVIFPVPVDIKGTLLFVKKLIAAGKFQALIDRQYPLTEIQDAFRYVASGQKTGNVIITLNPDS